MDNKILDDIAGKIKGLLPSSVKDAQEDFERNVKAILQNTFAKMDLVTREEFDTQTKVLSRLRAQLKKLEEQMDDLENQQNKGLHNASANKQDKDKT
jgi:BMFP domain-containing protein YqiC